MQGGLMDAFEQETNTRTHTQSQKKNFTPLTVC